MIMLSRVAERLYWMARYLERAEDTARLTQSFNHLIMDIPAGSEPGWDILVRILDAEPVFGENHRAFNEQNVLKFLIADEENAGSIHFCIKAARENVRTTRDVLPEEVWEHVNELYLFSMEHAAKSVGRRTRHAFLEQVVTRCQMINGLLVGLYTSTGMVFWCTSTSTLAMARCLSFMNCTVGSRIPNFSAIPFTPSLKYGFVSMTISLSAGTL